MRTILHEGPNIGGGRFGLPRFRQATRLITQPTAAAVRGRLFIALNTNESPFFGDGSVGSSIRLLASGDGGTTWTVATIASSTAADPQHVHPSIAADRGGGSVTVGYYVQQANSQLRTDATTVDFEEGQLQVIGAQHLSNVAFDLTPSNNPIPTAAQPFRTTNYERTIVACYDIGEYMSVSGAHGTIGAWGDNRNPWTSPADSPAAGTHAQPDVFFSRLED